MTRALGVAIECVGAESVRRVAAAFPRWNMWSPKGMALGLLANPQTALRAPLKWRASTFPKSNGWCRA